eukprot:SAG11_NODE_826_length_6982_cov_4.139038_6_plen_252_part_00
MSGRAAREERAQVPGNFSAAKGSGAGLLKAGKSRADKKVLYVGGLDEDVDEKLVHGAFIPFGDIKQIDVPLDQATQKHRGFCFVSYELEEDAAEALFVRAYWTPFCIIVLVVVQPKYMQVFFCSVRHRHCAKCCYVPQNMNNSELLGRVLKVNIAKPQSIKADSNKPIWADADAWAETLAESSANVDAAAAQAAKPIETTLPSGNAANKHMTCHALHILVDGEGMAKELKGELEAGARRGHDMPSFHPRSP